METTISALAAQLQPPRPAPVVPVLPALAELLPERGLRPGAAVVVGGSTALTLALVAAATQAGTWCAAVGFEDLGLVAVAESGVDLNRLALVERPGEHWEEAATALADAVGILLLRPHGTVGDRAAARITALARRHGCALVVEGGWPSAQVRLQVIRRQWTGVGQGRGRLRARKVLVATGGRGAAARGREVGLWLPDEDGAIRLAEPARTGAAGRRGHLAVAT
ncbi:hypothetical protein ACFYNO_14385 [Kitasatospora sp. NPDC006697]|uniref:hypothetical protein n=1 Tax=Kitasatospora sp. NPDC006697 TaxID=3364020 RepID=UPI00367D9DF1